MSVVTVAEPEAPKARRRGRPRGKARRITDNPELVAIYAITKVLESLSHGSRQRVLHYVMEKEDTSQVLAQSLGELRSMVTPEGD